MNQAAAAVPLAEKAVQVTEGNPELQALALQTQGWAQFRTRLPLQAKANLRRALGFHESAETQVRLAEVLIACQEFTNARAALERAQVLAAGARPGDDVARRIRELQAKLPPRGTE
jgi:hypothetical protein